MLTLFFGSRVNSKSIWNKFQDFWQTASLSSAENAKLKFSDNGWGEGSNLKTKQPYVLYTPSTNLAWAMENIYNGSVYIFHSSGP